MFLNFFIFQINSTLTKNKKVKFYKYRCIEVDKFLKLYILVSIILEISLVTFKILNFNILYSYNSKIFF